MQPIIFCLRMSSFFIFLGLAFFLHYQSCGQVFTESAETIKLSQNNYEIGFSKQDGSIQYIVDKKTGKTVSEGNLDRALWRLEFMDGKWVSPPEFSFQYRWDEKSNCLIFNYQNPEAKVNLSIFSYPTYLEFDAEIENAFKEPVLTLNLPHQLSFHPEKVSNFYFPHDLGLALKKGFFLPGDERQPKGWTPRPIGEAGLRSLINSHCQMLGDVEPPCELALTEEGKEWLGEEFSRFLAGKKAVVNRPPFGQDHNIGLVASKNGIYVPGYQLKGWGWLFRIGGFPSEKEIIAPIVLKASEYILTHRPKIPPDASFKPSPTLAQVSPVKRSSPPKYIGLIALKYGPKTGGGTKVKVAEWQKILSESILARKYKLKLKLIETLPDLLDILQNKIEEYFLVLNPYGEWFPSQREGEWEKTIEAIRHYVEHGGLWWETGGYPFYYELVPSKYQSLGGKYPSLFSDFVYLDSQEGALSGYGIQKEADIFVPATLEVGSREYQGKAIGYYDHQFNTFVKPREKWSSPVWRLEIGTSLKECLESYTVANEFKRDLRDKMAPELLEKFKNSLLLKYAGGTFRDQIECLDKLPQPIILHLVDYIHGGFDKQYPDFLPPHPSKGTMEEFRQLYERAHQLNMLVMPYLNPTWWCDDPPSPSLLKYGDIALARDLKGKIPIERYGNNWGYTLTSQHPVAKEIDKRNVDFFTKDLPSDILFQDQIGARSWVYDTNPACPTPYAYEQGLIDIAKEDCKFAPLSTECGFDRLINYEAQFCGLTWHLVPTEGAPDWVSYYQDWWSEDMWEFYPLALFMAHDKVAFTHHDLAQCITDKFTLSWSLVLGYQMIYALSPKVSPESPRFQWLLWLDAVQKHISSRYIGKKLTGFSYLQKNVMRSEFEDLTIIANLKDTPYKLSGKCVIAPFGFFAQGNNLEAGIFTEYEGKKYEKELWIIKVCQDNKLAVLAFAGQQMEIVLERPKEWEVDKFISGYVERKGKWQKVKSKVKPTKITFEATPIFSEKIIDIPQAYKGIALNKRPSPPKRIGVIALEPEAEFYSWTELKASDWLNILSQSNLVKKYGLEVVPIPTVEALFDICYHKIDQYLAVINPHGEFFPSPGEKEWSKTVEAARCYVENGGIWWEVGGYSFHYQFYPKFGEGKIVGWDTSVVASAGLELLGISCKVLPVEEPPGDIFVTDTGKRWLGEELAKELVDKQAIVNRPPASEDWTGALISSENGAYIAGYQLNGWGWLFRVGGVLNREIVCPVVIEACKYLYTHPPLVFQKKKPPSLSKYIFKYEN